PEGGGTGSSQLWRDDMKSPMGLEYDILVCDLSPDQQNRFIGEIVEICEQDVVATFEGRRVLVHESDWKSQPYNRR
ncbi:MAG: hypothetical protein V1685_04895, partial [Parcubacteria group bacterium]